MNPGQLPSDGIFRNPQSFTLLCAEHLLDKLRWELRDLCQSQWDENIEPWRQVVSYKAINVATTAWHWIEWIDEDTRRASVPRAALASLLNIDLPSDPPTPLLNKDRIRDEAGRIRNAMLEQCPELEICRVIAVASKHYEVRRDPNPAIRTDAYHSFKRREDESFFRPFMFLRARVNGEDRSMIEIFEAVLRFEKAACTAVSPGGEHYELAVQR